MEREGVSGIETRNSEMEFVQEGRGIDFAGKLFGTEHTRVRGRDNGVT
jgi:hypothetical protein